MKTSLRNVFIKIISGEWGDDDLEGNGTNIIRTTNFESDGKIDYKNVAKRLIQKKVISKDGKIEYIIDNEKIKQKSLLNGDIIIEKSGGGPGTPVGRVVYFENFGKQNYKADKDILDNKGKKIFYYYDDTHKGISIKAKLEDEKNYAFSFYFNTIDDRHEEIQSWDEIFGINGRYEKRAIGKADNWFRHYWEFLEKPQYNTVDMALKKEMYFDIARADQDIEIIKIPVIAAMENSPILSKAFQEAAKYKMNF